MANTSDNIKISIASPRLNGRNVLYTPYEFVDETNVVEVLGEVLPLYKQNQADIVYLQKYRRGVQPIINRQKTVRSDIKNIVVENIAGEIVDFKVGYLLGEPVQYVAREGADDTSVLKSLNELNNYCYLNKKSNLDKELAEDMYTTGTAYRMVLPNPAYNKNSEPILPPFKVYSVDPAFSGIVYFTGLGNKPLMSFTEVVVKEGNELVHKFCCYTDTEYFEIVRDAIVKHESHALGRVPMVEYPLNKSRMGGFECVITLLDAINTIESNRVDAIEQNVQAIMLCYNVEMDENGKQTLQDLGAISLRSSEGSGAKQDIKYLECDLNQDYVQTAKNDLYQDILNICGMPNRNGGYSTSDTGSAVIMRDGWSDAEARAKEDELMFRNSEMDFLELALHITSTLQQEEPLLSLGNIDIRFTRRNYENITQKTTVLTQLLSSDWVDPQEAYQVCGLFTDPELAYKQSKAYHDSLQEREPQEEEENKTTIVEENFNA